MLPSQKDLSELRVSADTRSSSASTSNFTSGTPASWSHGLEGWVHLEMFHCLQLPPAWNWEVMGWEGGWRGRCTWERATSLHHQRHACSAGQTTVTSLTTLAIYLDHTVYDEINNDFKILPPKLDSGKGRSQVLGRWLVSRYQYRYCINFKSGESLGSRESHIACKIDTSMHGGMSVVQVKVWNKKSTVITIKNQGNYGKN